MEIGIFYSKSNQDHRRTAGMIKKAAKNLGLSVSIIEGNDRRTDPLLVVNGIDVSNSLPKPSAKNGVQRAYDSIVQLLERSAWNAMW
jgi:hypothetical protein